MTELFPMVAVRPVPMLPEHVIGLLAAEVRALRDELPEYGGTPPTGVPSSTNERVDTVSAQDGGRA